MEQSVQDRILESISQAPMLSPSAARLLELIADADHDLQDVLTIIRADFTLTARILRVVNSAALSLLQPVASIDRAVTYLGERYVVGLAVTDCAAAVYDRPLPGYDADQKAMWRHHLYCAIVSRLVARHARHQIDADVTFTGGLLHDIGKAILSEYIKGTPEKFVGGISDGAYRDYLDAEDQYLGIDHVQAGYSLAKHWRLPEVLQQIILHHHNPSSAPEEYRALAFAVHLGDILSMMAGFQTGSDGLQYRIDEGYKDYFTLTPVDLERLISEANIDFDKFQSSLNS